MPPHDSDAPLLSGHLLLAAPDLLEPTFRRTVLLITNHGADEGALGYVMNRPLGKTVVDLLPEADFPLLADVPVYLGGPVSQEHLTFASLAWDSKSRRLRYQTHLSAVEAQQLKQEGVVVRAFVGYSGWAEGQLERELEESAWIVKPPVPDLLVGGKTGEEIWGKLIRDVSPLHRLAADMPDDLSLN